MKALRKRQALRGRMLGGGTGAACLEMPGRAGRAGAGTVNKSANPHLPSLCRSQQLRQSPVPEKVAAPLRAAGRGQSCSCCHATGESAGKRRATCRRLWSAGCRKNSCVDFKTWRDEPVPAPPNNGCPALLCLTFCSLPGAPFFKILPGQLLWPQNLLPHRHLRHRRRLGHRHRAVRR